MKQSEWTRWTAPRPPSFVEGSAVPMQQHPLYGAACAAMGGRTVGFVLAARSGGPAAWAQVLERRWPGLGTVAMLARGPVWDHPLGPDAQRAALAELLARLTGQYRAVMATPDPIAGRDPLSRAGWLALVQGGSVARLPLTGDAAALRARLHGKWRNRLVRAEAAGLRVTLRPFDPRKDHWLLEREAAQSRARGYKRLPPAFTQAWRAAGGGRAALLAVAERDGAALAGMVFLRHGSSASYHVGWTSDAGRACDAHRLLLFRSAVKLGAKGLLALDLGTLDTVTTPGLARFKLGAGAHQVQLSATRIHAPGSRWVARLVGDGTRADRTLPRDTQIGQADA